MRQQVITAHPLPFCRGARLPIIDSFITTGEEGKEGAEEEEGEELQEGGGGIKFIPLIDFITVVLPRCRSHSRRRISGN